MLERLFGLSENNTDAKRELIAGVTTFLTLAYIIRRQSVDPRRLRHGQGRGVSSPPAWPLRWAPRSWGFYANYPVALAPGMGLNA